MRGQESENFSRTDYLHLIRSKISLKAILS